MQVALDNYDRTTVYADLREEESLSDELRTRAIARARALGAKHVEFWRPPYGQGAHRMEGFIEIVRIAPAPQPERDSEELLSALPARTERRTTSFAVTGPCPPAATREDEPTISAHLVHENANAPYQQQRARGNTVRSSSDAAP